MKAIQGVLLGIILLFACNLFAQSGPPSPPDDGGTNGDGGSGTNYYYAPIYGSNQFWIETVGYGTNFYNSDSNAITLIVHGTTQNVPFQIQSTTNLSSTNWITESTFVGDADNYFTVLNLSMTGRSNTFFRAFNSSQDSDQSGLPDWWQQKYFGHTGVDPNGNPAGDGYSNLYKYQNGMNPNTYYTPAGPNNFSSLLSSNGNLSLNWTAAANLPTNGAGAVIGYTIYIDEAHIEGAHETFTTNLSASATNWQSSHDNELGLQNYFDDPMAYSIPSYSIQVNYANGNSLWLTNQSPFNPDDTVSGYIVRGSNGKSYIVASAIPQNVVAIRVYLRTYYVLYPFNNYALVEYTGFLPTPADTQLPTTRNDLYYFDVPVSNFTDGIYQITDSQLIPFAAYSLSIQGIGSDGNDGALVDATPTNDWHYFDTCMLATINIPFIDGRAQIAQNNDFQLRGAQGNDGFGDTPFRFTQVGTTNYVFSGYYFQTTIYDCSTNVHFVPALNEFQPFEENYLYDYFAYQPGTYDTNGEFTNGVNGFDNPFTISDNSLMFQTFNYIVYSNQAAIPTVLDNTPYILSGSDWRVALSPELDGCSTSDGYTFVLSSGFLNIYGLLYESIEYSAYPGQVIYSNAPVGTPFNFADGNWFHQTVSPELSTVDYYFARPRQEPLPGQSIFSITNTTPQIIIPFGQPFHLTAWAKQSLNNGFSGTYAYAQQYFDAAYLADDSGNATTNSGGILSEYGDFFPTQPGTVLLTTKADGATGSTGTNALNVIKLQLDVNHDGVMDLSFTGPDNTSQDHPFVFWLNNNYDRSNYVDCTIPYLNIINCDEEVDDLAGGDCPLAKGVNTPDCDYKVSLYGYAIPTSRDLEDYTRLWIPGLASLYQANTNLTFQLIVRNNDTDEGPSINVFQAVETNGGIAYLTNETVAQAQIVSPTLRSVGRAGPSQSINLNNYFYLANGASDYFIWCGARRGKGELVLQVLNGTNLIAETSSWIQLKDIREMYERYTVGDTPFQTPYSTAIRAGENLPPGVGIFKYDAPTDPNTPYILFVHGWNMTQLEKDQFAYTAYKRLYWQGYQGRFGAFRWPTGYNFLGELSGQALDLANFDTSEYAAWSSGAALRKLLLNLDGQYSGNVQLIAHSMGNIAAGEALRTNTTLVQTYIAMQAAVPSHAYDPSTPERSLGLFDHDDPERTAEYYTNGAPCYFNNTAGAQHYADFYNTNDYALIKWQTDQNLKPQLPYIYSASGGVEIYESDDGPFGADVFYSFPTNTFDIFAHITQARCYALGAQPDVGLPFDNSLQIDLGVDPYNFGTAHKYHSAEFRSDNQNRASFWSRILQTMGLKP